MRCVATDDAARLARRTAAWQARDAAPTVAR